jgi:hypothetical protein
MERKIEARLRNGAKKKGWLALKLVCPGFNGVPDRLVLKPSGKIVFVELKDGVDKDLSPRQKIVHALFKTMGMDVRILKTNEQVDAFLSED